MTEYEDKVVKVFVITDWHFKDSIILQKKKKKKNDFYNTVEEVTFF